MLRSPGGKIIACLRGGGMKELDKIKFGCVDCYFMLQLEYSHDTFTILIKICQDHEDFDDCMLIKICQ